MHEELDAALARQVAWCREPSPFTARLLERTRLWLQRAPDAADVLAGVAADPLAGAVALRWAGALHHLALRGRDPWARLWPPAPATDAELDAALERAWQSERPALTRALAHPPQTNEVQRSAALLPGLLHVVAATALPLRLLEIGASAGLNLWPDRHRYDYGGWRWGAADAPLALRCDWRGPTPATPALAVASRAGCDLQPIDLREPGEALRLTSFVWPDQTDRLQRLATAIAAVTPWMRAERVAVEALPAAAFVERELAAARDGVTTVLMHTIVWQYLPASEQAAVRRALEAAGRRATRQAPLAWLRLEPPQPDRTPELRCCLWPGGEDRLLGRGHAHVGWIEAATA